MEEESAAAACSRRSEMWAVRPQSLGGNQGLRFRLRIRQLGPPGGCAEGSSATMAMSVGTCPGATSLGLARLLWAAEGEAARGVAASGCTARRPRLIGVETTRADGRPTVFNTGNKSSRPMITACSPNDVSVVQLRRMRWTQEVSSMLSANILSSNMASSSLKSVCWYGHQKGSRGR